jgi:hypothetical protein
MEIPTPQEQAAFKRRSKIMSGTLPEQTPDLGHLYYGGEKQSGQLSRRDAYALKYKFYHENPVKYRDLLQFEFVPMGREPKQVKI